MPNLSGLDVICPMCAESYLETTGGFDPTIYAHAGMIAFKKQYTAAAGNQWTGPPEDPTAGYGMLECPGCEAPLAPSGYLIVADKKGKLIKMGKKQRLLVCPKCRSEAQERLGLLKLPDKELVFLTQVEGKEGVCSCPHHGEMTLEELNLEKPAFFGQREEFDPTIQLDIQKDLPEFICPDCKRSFNRKASLGSHMRVHKNETK